MVFDPNVFDPAVFDAGAATNAPADPASGTGSAFNASVHVQPNAGAGTGTGSAYDATVTVTTATNANAELASGTGTAGNASASLASSAGTGAGSGTAGGPASAVSVSPSVATGTGAAYDATILSIPYVAAAAQIATGTGTANGASIHVAPHAGLGSGTGAAYDSTVSTTIPTGTHVQSFGLDAHILSFGMHDRIDFHYGVQPDTAITYGDEVLDVVLARLFDSVASVTDPNTFRLYAYIADYIPSGDIFSLDAYIFAGHPITLDAVIYKVQKTSFALSSVLTGPQEWNVVISPTGGGIATYSAISEKTSPPFAFPGELASDAADGVRYFDVGGQGWRKATAGAIGDWWRVDWNVGQTIDRVMIFDGSLQSDGSPFTAGRFGNTGTVEFSDGSSVPYSGLNDTYLTLDIAPRTVTWMRIVSATAGGSSCGLAEVEAYNTGQFS